MVVACGGTTVVSELGKSLSGTGLVVFGMGVGFSYGLVHTGPIDLFF